MTDKLQKLVEQKLQVWDGDGEELSNTHMYMCKYVVLHTHHYIPTPTYPLDIRCTVKLGYSKCKIGGGRPGTVHHTSGVTGVPGR